MSAEESLRTCIRRALPALGVALIAVLCVGGFWWAVAASNREDAHWAQAQKRAFVRANTICGAAPRSIKAHGSSWNFGPWLQVTCQDGTVQVVQP